ncbi:alpha-ketoglutarate dehydrogenase component 4 [Achroia grisella]|uniref:alpha-ketoglutarate dehydrogenase component 4 n=1 Tax=Achroia grisella TaxID=688607 RepID=UPI0027D2C700|nr:alpha-ketoglutarate dehydrogenase component 4 [Achroia grisella]
MVRITTVLSRVPVIKFRKGGVSQSAGGSTVHATAPSASAPRSQSQPTAAMSTGPILDIDLPARYRRQPLSQEEIDHINGGGIV